MVPCNQKNQYSIQALKNQYNVAGLFHLAVQREARRDPGPGYGLSPNLSFAASNSKSCGTRLVHYTSAHDYAKGKDDAHCTVLALVLVVYGSCTSRSTRSVRRSPGVPYQIIPHHARSSPIRWHRVLQHQGVVKYFTTPCSARCDSPP